MAFPTGQANGATTVINGITYSYNSTDLSWSPTAATANASVVLTSGATFTGAVTFNTTPTFAAPLALQTGNASLPSLTFSGVTNTGIYTTGSLGNVAISTAGTNAVFINNSQLVGIGTTSPGNKLDVAGNQGFTTAAYIFSYAGGTSSQVRSGIYMDGTNTLMSFYTAQNERMRIDANGHLVPGATNTYDLGSSSLRWRNIYTQDLHLSNGIGDYTVIEGEEDLFLVNNKSGKSFKFALIEVDPSIVPPKSNC